MKGIRVSAGNTLTNLPYPDQERLIEAARDRFLRGGQLDSNVVRPVIEASWRRCHNAKVGLQRSRMAPSLPVPRDTSGPTANPALVEASAPFMADTRVLLAGSGTMIILADPRGVVLAMDGDAAVVGEAAGMGLTTGGEWSERLRGTNAIGTSLLAHATVHVHGPEHYCEASRRWTCSATVVRDPADGTVLGAVSVAGLSQAFSPHLLALVVATAGRIEAALAAREALQRERLLDRVLGKVSRIASRGLIVFDRRGRFVTTDARAGKTLTAMGVAADLEARAYIAALDTRPVGSSAEEPLPEWLRPEWLEPVIDGGERIGTLVVLPDSHRRMGSVLNGRLPLYRLRRATEFIDANLDREIRIDDLARVVGVSRYHFQRQFKQSTGVTPHQFIVRSRIERAKALLTDSDLPIVNVAQQSGFADQSHFTTLFRRSTSMTPKTYRDAMKA